jgi:hypothetical protein
MIVALAGRRVDSAEAKEPRFPLRNVQIVRTRARAVLLEKGATALVSSAACGADLIALSEAGQLGLRRRVILPFERMRFRETSVTDRPGKWGPLYDQVIDEVEAAGDLVILRNEPDDEAYSAANHVILDQAIALAKESHKAATAVLIWDGISRGDHDLTEEFGAEARKRGLVVTEVRTI